MLRLHNPWRRYDWGSTSDIPRFLRTAADGDTVAEVWMGTHALAPSDVNLGDRARPLSELVGHVPFMVKILAADKPLSIQVHPGADQAGRGFAEEEKAGVRLDDPRRRYKDPHAKPEMILALTTFDTLVGFRPTAEILRVLSPLDTPLSRSLGEQLAGDPGFAGIVRLLERILTDRTISGGQLEEIVSRAAELDAQGIDVRRAYATVIEVAEHHPGDRGVLVTLLMNRLTLQEGEAAYLAPGIIHAHLHGLGVEVMESSDNVLRAGLTSKPIFIPELIKTLEEGMSRLARITPASTPEGSEVYVADTDAFGLAVTQCSRAEVEGIGLLDVGQQILLCLGGVAHVANANGEEIELQRGEALFATPADGTLRVRGVCEVAQAYRPRRAAGDAQLVDLV